MRNRLKQLTPELVWRAGRAAYLGLLHARQWPQATFHPWRRASIRRLGEQKDLFAGERCFIIGNGPSLKHTDVSKLENEYTFGLNRIYLAFQDWGFETSFFVSVNDLVIQQTAAEIAALNMPKFLTWRAREWVGLDEYTSFLHTTYIGPKFARDARGRLWEGATVTYVALQLAFHMGFQQVILIGVDHNFATRGTPNTTITSAGDDPDHFHASYFGKGFRWQLPDLETSEIGYRMARQAYVRAGRQVLDATVGGKLTVFDKVDYASLF